MVFPGADGQISFWAFLRRTEYRSLQWEAESHVWGRAGPIARGRAIVHCQKCNGFDYKNKAYFQQHPSNTRLYFYYYYFSGFHFLQNKSKAQTENHKGTKSLSNALYASQKQDIRGGVGAWSSGPPGLPRQDQLKLKGCKTQARALALFTLKVLAFLLQIWPGSFGRH